MKAKQIYRERERERQTDEQTEIETEKICKDRKLNGQIQSSTKFGKAFLAQREVGNRSVEILFCIIFLIITQFTVLQIFTICRYTLIYKQKFEKTIVHKNFYTRVPPYLPTCFCTIFSFLVFS